MLGSFVYIASDPRPVFNSSNRILPNNSRCGTHLPLLVPFIFNHFQESILQLLSFHIHAGMGGTLTSPIFPFKRSTSNGLQTYPFSFHTLAHSLARSKTQLICFQAIAHSLPKTPGVGGYRSSLYSPFPPPRTHSYLFPFNLQLSIEDPDLVGTVNLFSAVSHGTRVTASFFAERSTPLLADSLRTLGGGSHGFIHVAGGLFAGIALALVAMLKILKIILENFRASLAQAFSGGFVQLGFCLLFGRAIRMLPELHDRSVSAPIALALPVALSLHLLVQRINQEVVRPQDEYNPCGPQNHKPLEHGAETPSPNLILADFLFPQAAPPSHGVHEYLGCASADAALASAWAARADNCLTIYWPFCQFPPPHPRGNLKLSQFPR
jgi:hypothetical protein